jgi:pyruvate formate lyase activating enzyme
MIVRVPVIPGFNANLDDIQAIGRFTVELGLTEMHLLLYHRYGRPKYASLGLDYTMCDVQPLANEQIEPFRAALEPLGLSVRIGG